MQVDWNAFTPWASLAGGALIGFAAGLLAMVAGRIAGVSGIVSGLLRPVRGDRAWRIAFIVGMVAAPFLYSMATLVPAIRIDASPLALVAGGLLVGWGSRLGSGCTSGHGVCGLARGSVRSLVATLVFMTVGFATVYIVRHVLA
ncbi:MAG TPA: YeeE/YedE family protein [Usitatibacter sp.]|nr:YeeE/YedE family protein [Usitatibacter sp.]